MRQLSILAAASKGCEMPSSENEEQNCCGEKLKRSNKKSLPAFLNGKILQSAFSNQQVVRHGHCLTSPLHSPIPLISFVAFES
ncbi:hypothetical protein AB3S75_002228 [Citrus x aurantiifolia]